MLSRRAFLSETAAGAALLSAGVLPAAQPSVADVHINETLERIVSVLEKNNLIAEANMQLVDAPSKGVVQWDWTHFRTHLDWVWIPYIRKTNQQLFHAMDNTRSIPGAQFSELLHEGLVRGRGELHIAGCTELYNDLRTKKRTDEFLQLFTSQQKVETRPNTFDTFDLPVSQTVYNGHEPRRMFLSPLTRLGAGFAHHILNGLRLQETECPILDAEAEKAELGNDPIAYQKWVIDERNKYFVQVIAACRRSVAHFLRGLAHDLTGDLQTHNELHNDAQISSVTLTVQGAMEYRERMKEEAQKA